MGLPPFMSRSRYDDCPHCREDKAWNDARSPEANTPALRLPSVTAKKTAKKPVAVSPPPRYPNPDPSRYDILRSEQVGRFLLVMLRYHGCTNYEGVKVSVYCDCTIEQLRAQKSIDPHFAENKQYHSPIARFEPTERGWNMARLLCVALTKKR